MYCSPFARGQQLHGSEKVAYLVSGIGDEEELALTSTVLDKPQTIQLIDRTLPSRGRPNITRVHEADVAGTEDLEGFALVEVSEPTGAEEAASHVPGSASAERSDSVWVARADEIARLIASGNLDVEIQEIVCDGIVEYTSRLLTIIELIRQTQVFSQNR